MKKCSKCGLEKTLECFHKDKRKKGGLQIYCIECKKFHYKESRKLSYQKNRKKAIERSRIYYQENKEKVLAYEKIYKEVNKEKIAATKKIYRDSNKEKIAASNKRYYEANTERIAAKAKVYNDSHKAQHAAYYQDHKEEHSIRNKLWMENNKEKRVAYEKAYRKENPEKIREKCRRRRAMKLEVNENYTKEDEAFTKNLFDHACFNCGSTENLEVDHYRPLSKGYALTLTNAIILCKSCNSSKNNKDPEQFFSEEQTMIIQEVFDMVEEQV